MIFDFDYFVEKIVSWEYKGQTGERRQILYSYLISTLQT